MVTFPRGRFWSFCFWAAVLGVMTLNPEAMSMLSLCCVVVCVLAQLINSTVHPAAILVRKRRVVDFMERDLRVTEFAQFLQSRGKDGDPPPLQRRVRIANQNIRLRLSGLTGLQITAALERHHALMTVWMPFSACVHARA